KGMGSSGDCRLLGTKALEKFAERLAKREDLAEIRGREIRTCGLGGIALAADLNHADDLAADEDRRADDFLDCGAVQRFGFDRFEHRDVARFVKVVVDLWAAFADGARGDGDGTRE